MAEVTGTLILRPVVSKGTITVTTPADTAIEDCYKLVNEDICDGLTTCVYLGKGETISFQLSNEYIHNITSITRATLYSYSTDNISGANSSAISRLIKWSDDSSVTSLGGLFDGEAEVCSFHSISLTNSDTFTTIKSLILSNDIGIYFGGVTSTKASPIISQIYLEVECTYTLPDDIDNSISFYTKQNGVWSLSTGVLYKKSSGVWGKINTSSLNIDNQFNVETATYISPLEYTLDPSQKYYAVTGANNCEDVNVIIPEKYKRVLVSEIKDNALAYSALDNVETISIPKTITHIGVPQFSACDSKITNIYVDENNKKYCSLGNCIIDKETGTLIIGCGASIIPNNSTVTSIGGGAFYRSVYKDIVIPNNIISISTDAFNRTRYRRTINVLAGNQAYHSVDNCLIETATKKLILGCSNSIIPNDGSVTSIDRNAFAYSEITSITIPDGVTEIPHYAFMNCSSLISITISSTVLKIGLHAFRDCYNIANIYYSGTKSQWNSISKYNEWFPGAGSYNNTSIVQCTDGNVSIV